MTSVSAIVYPPAAALSDESGGEEPETHPSKRAKASKKKEVSKVCQAREDEEEAELELDEGLAGDDVEMYENHSDDQVAVQNVDYEAPQIVDDDSGTEGDLVNDHHVYTRSSSCASFASSSLGPATSDFADTDGEEEIEVEVLPVVMGKGKSKSIACTKPKQAPKVTHQSKKLQDELPQVSMQDLPTSHTTNAATPQPAPASTLQPAPPSAAAISPSFSAPRVAVDWLERTNIPLGTRGRTFTTAMTGQNAEMKRVIESAIKCGKINMLMDVKYCPVGTDIKSIAFAALYDSAKRLGFDGQGDVAHRLEAGDDDRYVKPLVNYVTQCISQERKDLKNAHAATVHTAYGLNGP
ncbi:hypothetical protein D9758_018333 [Tetrapyrgos nigripes]|uniref:Uncharacterized protein n=1 Tax=Tetrapyrgos nigripes TaxID=182062 RepID=A0A8H5FGT7_9AGAR|nr:hypothetical protein D9758_018333 [Tetrapyrgos nigripes]